MIELTLSRPGLIMPVITISYEKDPRRLAQSPSTLPYTFDARSFPAIPSFEQRVTDGQAIQASVTRTWAGIVRYGPLKADLKGMYMWVSINVAANNGQR